MRAFFFNNESGKWLVFSERVALLQAQTPSEVPELLREVERRTKLDTVYAVGFITYEASSCFDSHFETYQNNSVLPAARFSLYKNCTEYPTLALCEQSKRKKYSLGPFIPEIQKSDYIDKINVIKEYLRKGESYQINFTYRLEASFSGDPFDWFYDLAQKKPGNYLAYLEEEDDAICSFSPELFFYKKGNEITLKPMKGTAPRVPFGDEEACRTLRSCEKNRAENLMIVDMIRNDAGRIAEIGSVEVPFLFDTEIYPTVIQMTSTVTARTAAGIPEIFTSLFPCASITGAPKIRSMEIIHELERSPRGLYTGTIGYITPDQDCLFNVAIRTAVIDKKKHRARYGTGSGIVWGSDAVAEWDECQTKTAILKPDEPFEIFESILLEKGNYLLLEKHLLRMKKSCLFFGLLFPKEKELTELRRELDALALSQPNEAYKVRLVAREHTSISIEYSLLTSLPSPYTLRLAASRVDPDDPFLRHKTNRRAHIEEALNFEGIEEDVILVNNRGELTETSRANIILIIEGRAYTPPVSCGLLPGVYREELLEKKEISEKVLYPDDLLRCEKIYVINSMRRKIEAFIK